MNLNLWQLWLLVTSELLRGLKLQLRLGRWQKLLRRFVDIKGLALKKGSVGRSHRGRDGSSWRRVARQVELVHRLYDRTTTKLLL